MTTKQTVAAKQLAQYDITHADTGDQVRAAFKEHYMVGYDNLFKAMPKPPRKPVLVAGPLTVDIVTSCHAALKKAKTPVAISRIVEAHRGVFNGRTNRVCGQMLNYSTVNASRIVEG